MHVPNSSIYPHNVLSNVFSDSSRSEWTNSIAQYVFMSHILSCSWLYKACIYTGYIIRTRCRSRGGAPGALPPPPPPPPPPIQSEVFGDENTQNKVQSLSLYPKVISLFIPCHVCLWFVDCCKSDSECVTSILYKYIVDAYSLCAY